MSTQKTIGMSLLFFALLLVLVLAACAGVSTGEPVGSQTTPRSTSPLITPTSPQATPTSSSKGHTANVTLSEFKIASSVRTFKPGISYHFVVTNQGNLDHEIMIVPTGLDVESMTMGEVHKVALLIIDDIAPGASQAVDDTFPASALRGHYEMSCHFRGHYMAGMKLSIKVRK